MKTEGFFGWKTMSYIFKIILKWLNSILQISKYTCEIYCEIVYSTVYCEISVAISAGFPGMTVECCCTKI